MKYRYIFIFIVLICNCLQGVGQTRIADSLKKVLKTQKEDTNKVNTLCCLSSVFTFNNADTSILLAQQVLDMSSKLGWKNGEAAAYGNIGVGYYIKGDYAKALENMQLGLKIDEELGRKQMLAQDLANIGNVYDDQGDYTRALDCNLRALKITEQLGNKKGQAGDLNNIGIIYMEQHNYLQALDYHFKAIKLCEEIGYKSAEANNLGNVGIIYEEQHNYPRALDYDWKALKIYDELHNKHGQARNLSNIGVIYFEQGDYQKAIENLVNALKINEEIGNKRGEGINLGDIGNIYIKTGRFKEAEEYLKKALVLDSSLEEKDNMRQTEVYMSELYDTTGNYKLALDWYKKASILKDTLFNEEKDKALTRKEVTYEFEKKTAATKAEQDKKDAQQKVIIWSVLGGLLLVIIFAGFIFRSLAITRKQKDLIGKQKMEVEHQKALVDEKNKDILDSIQYAQYIQKALLASGDMLNQNLPHYFVLFKPKDIVSGDFYWATKQNNRFYLAACDSTGHGVPGAFMSLLNISFLNEAITEKKIIQPNEVFNHVRKRLIENISQDGQQDGMDGILVCMETGKEMAWVAAHNPPIIIRKGEIMELAADKIPVGKSPMEDTSFKHHEIKMEKGDILYLFTDGYADQFGGPKGKKFKYKQLQGKLLAISPQPLNEQKKILEQTFDEWKGELEQVDDILVIGIKV